MTLLVTTQLTGKDQTTMQNQFAIGDKVQRPAFTDCFGDHIPQSEVLTVTEIRLFTSGPTTIYPIKPYFRLVATTPDGFGYLEGAERYFKMV